MWFLFIIKWSRVKVTVHDVFDDPVTPNELPLVLVGLVGPDVTLVNADKEGSVSEELGEKSARPKTLLIELRVLVMDSCTIILPVP